MNRREFIKSLLAVPVIGVAASPLMKAKEPVLTFNGVRVPRVKLPTSSYIGFGDGWDASKIAEVLSEENPILKDMPFVT